MANTRKPLRERMKQGELYVVFGGIEDSSLRFHCYGDPASTPRIYCKETLDDRISDQLRICKSVETANKRLGPETYAVVLPLSAFIAFCGGYEVKRWAAMQESVSPKEVREYVSKCGDSRLPRSSRDSAADQDFLIKQIVFDHSRWISSNPEGTLTDLLRFLECVRFDFLRYDDDELIADHFEYLRSGGSEYLLDFGDPSKPDDKGELPTIGYRLETLVEDLQHVDDLIELVGESFKVADFPSREDVQTPSSLALVG